MPADWQKDIFAKHLEHNTHMAEVWDREIEPSTRWYKLNLASILRFKDLIFLFVYRDFVSVYKQTILGPIWFFIQPLITTITFTLVFGRLAHVSTDGSPKLLFYLAGVTLWNYFADTLIKTSETFTANANIFGKVYFPRIVVPLSIVISNLIKFAIQLLLFLAIWTYFLGIHAIHPNTVLLFLPFLILLMGILGFGFGILISSITTKYRDLKFLIAFGVQISMYATPIVYPISFVPQQYRWIVLANPVTSIIETFKFGFLGVGEFNLLHLLYSLLFATVLVFLGLVIFNKVEKSFMDTV